MTFELGDAAVSARSRARTAAAGLADAAAAIDRDAVVPAAVRDAVHAVVPEASPALPWVVALEEVAVVSAALALDAALPPATAGGSAPAWPGLRGLDPIPRGEAAPVVRRDLAVAAVLVGLGRGALDGALATLRGARDGGGKPEQQHWGVADAATELEAARLLVWRAASAPDTAAATAVAMARLQARLAAESAVAAARRVASPDAAAAGTSLDRITRDVATATLVFGGADEEEAAVAAGVLPG
jgi:hypothetical protein